MAADVPVALPKVSCTWTTAEKTAPAVTEAGGAVANPSFVAAAALTVKERLLPLTAPSVAFSEKLPALVIEGALKVATPALALALDGVIAAGGVVASAMESLEVTRFSKASRTSTVTADPIDAPAVIDEGCAVKVRWSLAAGLT